MSNSQQSYQDPKNFYNGDNPETAIFKKEMRFVFKFSKTSTCTYINVVKPYNGLYLKEEDVPLLYTIGQEYKVGSTVQSKKVSITYKAPSIWTWNIRLIKDFEDQLLEYVYSIVDNSKKDDMYKINQITNVPVYKQRLLTSMVPHLRDKKDIGIGKTKNLSGQESIILPQIANIKLATVKVKGIDGKLTDKPDPLILSIKHGEPFGISRPGCQFINYKIFTKIKEDPKNKDLIKEFIKITSGEWTHSSINKNIPAKTTLKMIHYVIKGGMIFADTKVSIQSEAKYIAYNDERIGDQEDPFQILDLIDENEQIPKIEIMKEELPQLKPSVLTPLDQFYQMEKKQ